MLLNLLEKHLCDQDFVDIRFIDYELRWIMPDDFITSAKDIKRVYNNMNLNQKKIYKWYCYANIHTTMHQKNKIWDYLNGYTNYYDVVHTLLRENGNYRTRDEE